MQELMLGSKLPWNKKPDSTARKELFMLFEEKTSSWSRPRIVLKKERGILSSSRNYNEQSSSTTR